MTADTEDDVPITLDAKVLLAWFLTAAVVSLGWHLVAKLLARF